MFKGWNGKMYVILGTWCYATYQATEFANDPAGTLKMHVYKQGWTKAYICALVHKSYTAPAAEAAMHDTWCRKMQKMLSGADILHNLS